MYLSTSGPRHHRGLFSAPHNNMKFALILVLLLVVQVVLAACGDSTTVTTGATSSTSSGTTTTGGQVVTLNLGWWSNSAGKDAALRSWLDEFEKSHPNIKIKSEIIPWNNYWDKIKTTTAGGNAYDLVGMGSFAVAPYLDSDQFVDLNGFADFQEAAKGVDPNANQLLKWNNKQYGMAVGVAMPMIGYNKTLFQDAGVPLPDPLKPMTLTDFKAMAKKLTKTESGKVTQYALHPSRLGIFVSWENLVTMAGGQAYDNFINPTKITINTAEGIQGLSDWLSLFEEKIIPPIDEFDGNVWGSGNFPSLQTGKVAMARLGPWDFLEITSKNMTNIGVAPMFVNKQRAPLAGINGYGIYKGSKYSKEAWEFIKWAVQTPQQLTFATFSDVPVDKTALSQLDTVVKPKEFIPTLVGEVGALKPTLMTGKAELGIAMNKIATDLARGKFTPAQAAAEMEKQGNAILAKK